MVCFFYILDDRLNFCYSVKVRRSKVTSEPVPSSNYREAHEIFLVSLKANELRHFNTKIIQSPVVQCDNNDGNDDAQWT